MANGGVTEFSSVVGGGHYDYGVQGVETETLNKSCQKHFRLVEHLV